jgi:hypothetical protein
MPSGGTGRCATACVPVEPRLAWLYKRPRSASRPPPTPTKSREMGGTLGGRLALASADSSLAPLVVADVSPAQSP